MDETTLNGLIDTHQTAKITVEMDFPGGERKRIVFDLDEHSGFSIGFKRDKVELPSSGPWHEYAAGPETHWTLRFNVPTGEKLEWVDVTDPAVDADAAKHQREKMNAEVAYLKSWQLFSDHVGTVLIQHRCGHTLDIPASRSAYLSDIVQTVLQQRKEHACEGLHQH